MRKNILLSVTSNPQLSKQETPVVQYKILPLKEEPSFTDAGESCTHGILIPAVKFIGTKQSSRATTILDVDANSKDQA